MPRKKQAPVAVEEEKMPEVPEELAELVSQMDQLEQRQVIGYAQGINYLKSAGKPA